MVDLSIKARFGVHIRRFKADVTSLAHLQSKLLEVFQNYRLPDKLCIKYKDDENEWVTCETEEEWTEALQAHPQNQVLNIAVCDVPLWEKVPTYVEVCDSFNARIAELNEALKKSLNEENEAKLKSVLSEAVSAIKNSLMSIYNQATKPSQNQEEEEDQEEEEPQQQQREYTVDIDLTGETPVKIYPGAPKSSVSSSSSAVGDSAVPVVVSSSPPDNDEAVRILQEMLKPVQPESEVELDESEDESEDEEIDNGKPDEDWVLVREDNRDASLIQQPPAVASQPEPVQEEEIIAEEPVPVPEVRVPEVPVQAEPVPEVPVPEVPVVEVPVQAEPVPEVPVPVPEIPVPEVPAPEVPVVEVPAPEPAQIQPVEYVSRFVDDLTIPDGTAVPLGSWFIKTWRIRNNGTVQWPAGVQLKFLYGDELHAPAYTPVKAALPGEDVDVSVRLLAPKEAGNFKAFFRLVAPNDEQFGHKVWVNPVVIVRMQPQQPVIPQPQQPMPRPMPMPQQPQMPIPISMPQMPMPQPQQPQVRSKWHDKLVSLHDMGFTNDQLNISLLDKYNGDLPRVIHHLLGA